MIRPYYALKLARTKIRSKRGVLIASIIVSSLLFATLIATVIVFNGAEKSAVVFIKKSGNDKYLVKAQPNIPYDKISFNLTPTLDEIRKIKAFEKQYYQDLREKYKSLNLEYDETAEIPALEPYAFADKKLPEEQRVKVNFFSPVIQAMNMQKFEEYAKTATNKANDLRKIGAKYGASGYTIVDQPSAIPSIPKLRFIQDDREDFGASEPKTGGDFGDYGYFTHAIYNGMYSFTDQKNLSRYILTTNSLELKGIPVVVSAQEAASLFGKKVGIGEEPKLASEKKAWLKDIQEKLNGQTYQACYRNSTEQAMLEKIQRDYADMKNNENSKEYQKPSLIYDYPKEVCGDIVIKEDTRTNDEKQVELKLEEAQQKLDTYVAPVHKLLTFQIVGVKYAQPFLDYTKGIEEYVKSLLVSPQGDISSIEIPTQLYDALPSDKKINDIQKQEGVGTIVQAALIDKEFAARILEFSTVEDARSFLDNETCRESASGCTKRFVARPYGSNYLILDEISRLFNKLASVAFPVVLGLSVIIIWFTISRIMTENRKETAVYRAMGARRHDVATIYLLYVFLVALQIAIVSTVLGVAVAFVVDSFYGSTLSDTAVALFGIIDDAPRFSLFNIESPLLTVVVGSIFVISIIASIQPLIRNVRRNPISDMRDE